MRCDLHVHSYFSGMCKVPLVNRVCRECYSPPEHVYEALKNRGMHLVTLTDHDSIEGSESLRRHLDFFLSEEVTCTMPSGTEIHVGVYDITERQHLEIQRRRGDLARLLAYLTEKRILFVLNHAISTLTGRRDPDDFNWFARYFPVWETRNGHMLVSSNRLAGELAARHHRGVVGGSDAHTLKSLASAYTEVPLATSKEEFLRGLRHGRGHVRGESGGCWKLTRDLLFITLEMMKEEPRAMALLPLLPLIPAAAAVNYVREIEFARRCHRWVDAKGFSTTQGSAWNPWDPAWEV